MLVKGSIADRALLEACRRHLVVHLVYAMPPFPAVMEWTEKFYMRWKTRWITQSSCMHCQKSDELMVHDYSKLYNIWNSIVDIIWAAVRNCRCVFIQKRQLWIVKILHTSGNKNGFSCTIIEVIQNTCSFLEDVVSWV